MSSESALMGVAKLSKMAFDGADLWPLWRRLVDRYVFEPADADALMDLSTVEQLFGNLDVGLARQAEALALQRLYRSPCDASPPALRLLAFAAAGDIGANVPLEFLLEGSGVALDTLYVVPGLPLPALPDHDVAIVAAAQSDEHAAALDEIARLVENWPRPVLNRPAQVVGLAREQVCRLLSDVPGIIMPLTARIDRASLEDLGTGATALERILADGAFPLIVRPVDSHAGIGLARLESAAAVAGYLAERREAEFYISRFVDYPSADGLYRKYRIVLIDGRAYACHMAIADQWKIWYLNAGMKESAEKRAEEERFMAAFDEEFGRRHAAALATMAERVGLDYFGIDCAETADGQLLVFEADIAMIVHAMDDPAVYPYKGPQMRKVFDAFCAMLRRAAEKPSGAGLAA